MLRRIRGCGSARFGELLAAFPQLRKLFDLSRRDLFALGLDAGIIGGIRSADRALIEPDLEWLSQPNHYVLRLTDPLYPPQLRDIANAPPLLFVQGEPRLLSLPQLAVVGSRNPSRGGFDNAFEFARHLAHAGVPITSGLALGVDAAAHEGALAAGGVTIAVVGTGLDRVYPARHRDLAHRISQQGALVSEFPIGTGARPENFPRRNRIISGLSLGTLVVEASLRSGSLITARYATEQGREVFAIPGSIHNPLARGCHALIRQGAKLVETATDVLEELPPPELPQTLAEPDQPLKQEARLDEDYRRVLDALGHDPTPLDTVIASTQLTPAEVSSILLVLELEGYVTACPGGRYARTRKGM